MEMLNKAIIMGRLTRDPELRHTQSNMPVCSFTLAIDRDRRGPNNERQTDFIDCVAWSRTAEFVNQWFTKGMMAIVVGRIQSRNWEDKNGNKRVTIEINCDEVSFGETKKSREGTDGASMPSSAPMRSDDFSAGAAPAFDLPVNASDFAELSDDNDIPF